MSVDPVSFQILGSLLSFGPLGREEFVQSGGGPATSELVEYVDEVGALVYHLPVRNPEQAPDDGPDARCETPSADLASFRSGGARCGLTRGERLAVRGLCRSQVNQVSVTVATVATTGPQSMGTTFANNRRVAARRSA